MGVFDKRSVVTPKFLLIVFALFGIVGFVLLNGRGSTDIKTPKSQQKSGGNNWVTFTSEQFDFSVLMPTKPMEEKSTYSITRGDPVVTKYQFSSSINSNTLLQVTVEVLPFDVSTSLDLESLRDIRIKGELKRQGGVLLNSRVIQYDGYPAIDYKIKNGENVYTWERYFVKKNRKYSLRMASSNDVGEYFNQFSNSFKLTF